MDIADWEMENEKLIKEMDRWRTQYNHRNPCVEYKKYKFCKHLIKARTQKFGERIKTQINRLIELKNKEGGKIWEN